MQHCHGVQCTSSLARHRLCCAHQLRCKPAWFRGQDWSLQWGCHATARSMISSTISTLPHGDREEMEGSREENNYDSRGKVCLVYLEQIPLYPLKESQDFDICCLLVAMTFLRSFCKLQSQKIGLKQSQSTQPAPLWTGHACSTPIHQVYKLGTWRFTSPKHTFSIHLIFFET